MSDYCCQPVSGPLRATVTVPGSKSITNRALITAALGDGCSLLTNILLAEDTCLMIDALRALGVAITIDEESCNAEISGCAGSWPMGDAELFCGNAGTVMRFCTAVAAIGVGEYKLDGVARMRERPIGTLVKLLQAMGTGVEYLGREGFPPLKVYANRLRGGRVSIDSPESSQFISAVLLAAPCAANDVMLEVTGDLPSKPYLETTTAVMEHFGVSVLAQYEEGGAKFVIPAPQRYQGRSLAIEPDASNATYFLAAPAVAGGWVTVEGLGEQCVQGDVDFVAVLERMGCSVERSAARISVAGPKEGVALQGIDIDLNDMPDTVPTLAVVALFAQGPTTIRNVANLRVKETDRIAALATELTRVGAEVEERDDGLTIHPPKSLEPVSIETYGDHRMAMSFALAGLRIENLVIRDPLCCAKTFPDFFDRWDQLSGSAHPA